MASETRNHVHTVYPERFVFVFAAGPLVLRAHRIGSYGNQNLETKSLRGGLRERPPPNPDVASLTTRWESRAQKDSFFSPCSFDSCSAHRIGSYRNQKMGDDKFERRPRRAPPPNPDVASLTTRWKSSVQKYSFFKKITCLE
jgi:hypothetical protein